MRDLNDRETAELFPEEYERAEREVRELARNQRRLRSNKYRNRPCPCGSGRKYKNCCRGGS